MLNPKTHFEQVPLEAVRKMMEEQGRQETSTVQAQAAQKTILEEDLSGGPGTTKGEFSCDIPCGGIEAINESRQKAT